MKAAFLKLNFSETGSVGFCTLKFLLGKYVKGKKLKHAVVKDRKFSAACRCLLDRIIVSARVCHTNKNIEAYKPRKAKHPHVRDVQRTKTSHRAGQAIVVEKEKESEGRTEAQPQNTQGRKETKVAHRGQEKK